MVFQIFSSSIFFLRSKEGERESKMLENYYNEAAKMDREKMDGEERETIFKSFAYASWTLLLLLL